MKKAFNIDVASIFGMIFGLGGLLFAAYQVKKQDDLAKKLDLSIEELEKKTSVEVTDSAVNKALDRAVEREVRSAVADAVRDVKNDIHAELSKTVEATHGLRGDMKLTLQRGECIIVPAHTEGCTLRKAKDARIL